MTETTILDESAVNEIEALSPFSYANGSQSVVLTLAQRDALCATVKHLREMMADPVFGFQELQAKLAQAQKDRDYWRTRATEAEKAAEKWYHERY